MANYKDSVALTQLSDRLGELIDRELGGFKELAYDALPGCAKIMRRHAGNVALQHGIYDPNGKRIHLIYSFEFYSKKKYKSRIFVGDLKKVKRKQADSEPHIPLWNITEYGTKRGVQPRPIMDDIVNASADEIVAYMANYIQNNLY